MENTNIVLRNVRLSYVHILKAYARVPGAEAKYQTTILVPKTDIAAKAEIDRAIEAAKTNGITGKWNGVAPAIVATPVHDGDGLTQNGAEYGPECKGHWVFTASSAADKPVEVVDANLNPIISPIQIYSGIYANISVNFFPYNFQGKKGIGCGLGPVQKVADGEPLGGQAPSAKSVFTAAQPSAVQKVNPLTGQPM